MNHIIITRARLTADPTTRAAGSTTVTSFSVATDGNRKKDRTSFFDVSAFGKTGEFIAKWFKRGSMINIYGEPIIDEYTNKNGQKVRHFNIIAENVEFGDSKSSGNNGKATSRPSNDFIDVPNNAGEEGLPFPL